jgi:hypothetical protein
MLRWVRLRAVSLVTALVLCASVGTIALGPLTHADEHESLPTFVEHDAAAHTFRAATAGAASHPLHCLVCQWARSYRPHPGSVTQLAPTLVYSLRVHTVSVLAPLAAIAAQPPLRSPPQHV